ncbi:hypothetical protein JVU11DRAFT_8304 [Chiua virens]|nr:hypothetical protein JVU11DRAFT_8304 [Chiua virens]
MAEPTTYPCTYRDCKKVFTRAHQLKKHIIAHEAPDSLHYCPRCNFYSCQKKNLLIHLGTHTGEKNHRCPDMICHPGSHGSPPCVEHCDYKTNDPAALTKHRKKKHGYVPSPNRTRGKATSTSLEPKSRKGGNGIISQRYHPYGRPVTSVPPSREPSLVRSMTTSADNSPEPPSICSESSEDSSPFIRQGDVNVYGWPSVVSDRSDLSSNASAWESSIVSSATRFAAPKDNTKLDALYDPTLDPHWMAQYDAAYSSFNTNWMGCLPESYNIASPFSDALASEARTGREGCLCPDWMVDAGIEGWDQSALDAHKEFLRLVA